MSGGRLTVQVFSAGELVPPLQSLDAVIDGSAEMSHGAAYYWQNKNAGLSFFTGVPYGMTSREMAAGFAISAARRSGTRSMTSSASSASSRAIPARRRAAGSATS
jgi:TRAP-type mannitol/chloroaromatic compound transport system substrate-binding protein